MASVDPLGQESQSNILGKFRLLAELGRGGMSEVYLAVIAGPAGFNKLVVIKLIKAELAEDPEFISMFLEEARLSARLSHPNVVQTNEVGEVHGRYYIAMEYLEGQPYSRIIHRLGRDRGLPLGMSLRILSDVLQGLHYAHDLADFDGSALSVVHRDVTPHNIFVTYDGQVKVVDFGIAKAMNSSHETRTGMLKGKVGYMAPEQARAERVDRRADLFSVGVMLWEAAVGRRLWKGMNEVQILHQLISGDIPSPRSIRPDISQKLESIIMRTLATNREHRPPSALALQGELEELMDAGNERSTLREVGRLMTGTFDDDRRKLKLIIEQQLAKSTQLPTAAYQQVALPNVAQQHAMTGEAHAFGPSSIPRMGSGMANTGSGNTGNGSHSHSGSYSPVSYQQQSGAYPNMQQMQQAPQSQRGGMHGYSNMGESSIPSLHGPPSGAGHQSSPSVSNVTGSIARASVSRSGPQPMLPAQGGGNKLILVAAGGVAAASMLGLILYFGLSRTDANAQNTKPTPTGTAATDAATAPKDAPTAQTSAAASAAAPASSISLSVKVSPSSAEIRLDGDKVGVGKVKTSIPQDGKEHELRVDANGYQPKIRKIAADEDVVDWEPELKAARTGSGAAATQKQTDTAPVDDTPKVQRDKNGHVVRKIDPNYPGG